MYIERPKNKEELSKILSEKEVTVRPDDFSKEYYGKVNFLIDENVYKCLFFPSNKNGLIVFFSAQGNNENCYKYPVFQRLFWARFFECSVLYMDDSTRLKTNFSPCWYLGEKNEDYMYGISEIIKTIAHEYNISNNEITYIGSSNTGFPVMHLCCEYDGSYGICLNAQVDIPLYLKRNKLEKIFCEKMKYDLNDVELIARPYIENLSRSKILFSYNLSSDIDYEQFESLSQWCGYEKFDEGLRQVNDNIFILAYHCNSIVPHRAQPQEDFVAYLSQLIKRDVVSQDYLICKAFISSLKRYYETEKINQILNTKISSNKTGRIDIKNNGQNNNCLYIKNCSDENAKIIEPPFLCDDQGRGKVITSQKGLIDIEFTIYCDGELKIWLRGPDIRDERNKVIPIDVRYTSFIVDDMEVLEKPVNVSVTNPFVFSKSVKNLDCVYIHLEWSEKV